MSPWHQHTARMKELSRARVWCRLVSLHTLGGLSYGILPFVSPLLKWGLINVPGPKMSMGSVSHLVVKVIVLGGFPNTKDLLINPEMQACNLFLTIQPVLHGTQSLWQNTFLGLDNSARKCVP